MDSFWSGFAVGVYIAGAVASFSWEMFWCMLGGRSEDLWRPFAVGFGWPFLFAAKAYAFGLILTRLLVRL